MLESLICCHFHILVGIFHYRTWLVYFNDGLPQKCPRSSWASKLDAHPLSFSLSFHILIALVHPLHGNPYSLTLISINVHLHSPLIRLVDVRLSSPFLSSPQPPFYSTYSAMSMAHAHVLRESWKGLRTSKVWNNCLACHRGCARFEYFVWWRWSIARLYDFVGITFFGLVILKRHDCFISRLEVLLFLCQMIDYCFESLMS